MTINRWNGSAWVPAETVKRWDGAAWVAVGTKQRWNGTAWEGGTTTPPPGGTPPTVRSVSSGYAGTTSPTAVTLPAGFQAGDLLVLVLASQASGSSARVPVPAGWTLRAENPAGAVSTGTRAHSVFSKVAVGNESGFSLDTSSFSGSRREWVCLAIQDPGVMDAPTALTVATALTVPLPTLSGAVGDLAIGVDFCVTASPNTGAVTAAPSGWDEVAQAAGPVVNGTASADWLRVWARTFDAATATGSVTRNGPAIAAGCTYGFVVQKGA